MKSSRLQVLNSIGFRIASMLAGTVLVSSCVETITPVEIELPDPVGEVVLLQSQTEPESQLLLDIGVLVFEIRSEGGNSESGVDQIFSQIRQTESQYLPTVLRNKLVETNQWGAVRVLPRKDPSVDLLIAGVINQSDGLNLELKIHAWDSTGRIWLDKIYYDITEDKDYPLSSRRMIRAQDISLRLPDPFQDLYEQIANDLLLAREELVVEELINIAQVSQLQYARDLSPDSFVNHLLENPDGTVTVNRLIAENDPMSLRVADMRLRHHLFIDTIDEYYADLLGQMQSTYDLWRQTSREQELETQAAANQSGSKNDNGYTGSFNSIRQSYNRYKWSKIYAQEFTELAYAFNAELAPAIHELRGQVHRLSGSIDDKYLQWREILRSLFELETGQDATR